MLAKIHKPPNLHISKQRLRKAYVVYKLSQSSVCRVELFCVYKNAKDDLSSSMSLESLSLDQYGVYGDYSEDDSDEEDIGEKW